MKISNVMNFGNLFKFSAFRESGGQLMKVMNYIGPLLCIFVHFLLAVNAYVYFWILLPILYLMHGPIFTWICTMFAIYLIFSVAFNHIMGSIIKPGWLKDYYVTEESEESLEIKKQEILYHKNNNSCSSDLAILMKYAHPTINDIKDYTDRICKRWNWLEDLDDDEKWISSEHVVKPLRFHVSKFIFSHTYIALKCLKRLNYEYGSSLTMV